MGLTQDQQRCVETLDRAIVVAAGAGSGKTFTLTKRIIGAFDSGFIDDIDQVMAITFTRKAAGELKSRIKAALRASGRIEQALKVDGAWISTIHGMCGRILRAHAVELGLDPKFTVAEGPDLSHMISRAIDAALAQARGEQPERVTALFGEYRATSRGWGASSVEDMLQKMVETAGANPAGPDAFVVPKSRVNPLFILENVVSLFEGIRELAEQQNRTKSCEAWLASADGIQESLQRALEQGLDDPEDVLEAIAPFKLDARFGVNDYKAAVKKARLEYQGCVMSLRLRLACDHVQTLVDIARDAYARFTEEKRRAGVLDNNDLLVLAARAIDGNPRIAECYTDAFRLIMVDEFQDTDQLQVDMVKRLAGPGFERLCTVGDAQQSIYRFRGADVSVYRRHLASVAERDASGVIELHKNFRSHGDVLAFVRTVFGRPEMLGGEFMDLERGRNEDEVKQPFTGKGPRVLIQHTTAPHTGAAPQAALKTAARRIAEHFAYLRREKDCPASDMVLLLGIMKNAGEYAQALRDAGLPCVIAGGTVFPTSLEALTVLDAVRVLADPHDARALYRLLSGPLFCLSPDELLMLATASGADGVPRRRPLDAGLSALMRAAAAGEGDDVRILSENPRLACAVRVLGDALRDVGAAPVARIVRSMVVDAGWLSRLEGEGAVGLAGAGNILKALRFLESEEQAGGMGPAQLAVRYAELLDGLKEGPGALSAGDGDFVRIMTVHASKGLEFPIVALAEMGERESNDKLLLEDVGGRIYLSLDLSQTPSRIEGGVKLNGDEVRAAYAAAFDEGVDEDDLARILCTSDDAFTQRAALSLRASLGEVEERKRLLYVALTRAREALVVSVRGAHSKSNPVGLPKSVLAETALALGYGEGDTIADRATFEFGGEQGALVERVVLQAGETADDVLGPAAPIASGDDDGTMLIALPEGRSEVAREPFRQARSGVFSYSSVADAAHEGDLLDVLADAYAAGELNATRTAASNGLTGAESDTPSSEASPDDAFWDEAAWDAPIPFAALAADSDKATDLGTAFHRLAQYAVCVHRAGEPLAMPPADRIEALSRTCALGPDARLRLRGALKRWFASDVAASVADCADLRAEVPFYVRIDSSEGRQPRYLEGEIDLLALSDDGLHARVIDYKTGGSDDETPADLSRKHVLQAACYAYVLMRAGVQSVDAIFVRVERADAQEPEQPQTVTHRFAARDLDALERAIARAAG